MNWLQDIVNAPIITGGYAQNNEETPLFFILENIGLLNARSMLVVDFGAGDGRTMSNARLLMDRGWTGRLVDVDPKGAADVIAARITMHNAGTYALGCNVLLIDIDGNDFWVLDGALRTSLASLILCEINTRFAREESFAIKYNPAYVWDCSDGYGMSLEAAIRLGDHHGYSPVHLHNNQNLFLLRNDLLPEGPLPDLKYTQDLATHPHDPNAQWIPIPSKQHTRRSPKERHSSSITRSCPSPGTSTWRGSS